MSNSLDTGQKESSTPAGDIRSRLGVSAVRPRKLGLWIRLFPVVFFLIYLGFTVFLFAYGPWPYPITEGFLLYGFLAAAHLALLMGYLSAAFGKPRGYFGRWKVERVLVLSLLANLALLWPTTAFRTGRWVPDVRAGISNPGAAYSQSQALRMQGVPIIEYIRILAGPLLFLLLPLAIFYRRQLRPRTFWLSVLVICGTVAMFAAMGTNKGIADTLFLVLWLLLAGHLSGLSRLKRRHKIMLLASSVLGFGLFFGFFASGMATRSGSGALYGYFTGAQILADQDNFLIRNLPSELRVGVLGLTSYLTQGYYGLYLSLKEPFVPMFGVGNSMFLSDQVASIVGVKEITRLPYPMRIEKYGWDGYRLWSSIYPWIASDVSFPGTILVVFLIGRLFAQSWLDTLRGENPFAVAAFAQFVIMLFYFPANNQVAQSGESLTAFLSVMLCWVFTRRKYRLRLL